MMGFLFDMVLGYYLPPQGDRLIGLGYLQFIYILKGDVVELIGAAFISTVILSSPKGLI